MTTTPQRDIERERPAFEAAMVAKFPWLNRGTVFGRMTEGDYVLSLTETGWQMWLAARAAQATAEPCRHRIVDARNPVVMSGYICVDCGALFMAANHDTAPATPTATADKENTDISQTLQRTATADSAADACKWISVDDRLPDTAPVGGSVPTVVVCWKPEALADNLSQVDTANTVFVSYNKHKFTHWMPLPAPPIAAMQPTTGEG